MFNIKMFSVLLFILALSIISNKLQYDRLHNLNTILTQLESDKKGLDGTITQLKDEMEQQKMDCKVSLSEAIRLTKESSRLSCTNTHLADKIDLIAQKEYQKADKGGAYVQEIHKDKAIEEAPRVAKLDDVIPDCDELCRVLDEAYRAAKGSH